MVLLSENRSYKEGNLKISDYKIRKFNVRGKMILPPHGKEFFTSYGKHFFTWVGKDFFTRPGKQIFT